MEKLNIFSIAGIFFTGMILLIWFGSIGSAAIQTAKTGDFSLVLKNTGGRIFAIDHSLKQETDILLQSSEEKQDYIMFFHFAFALSLLFLFFLVGYLLFRLGNWLSGINQFTPSTDILIVVLVLLIFLSIEFLYSALVLKEMTWPLSGVWYFLKNLPKIFTNLFGF